VIQLLTCDSRNMQTLRLSIVGFGTVGRWLAAAMGRHCFWFEAQHGVAVSVVGVANRRDGFVYRDAGFDTTTLFDSSRRRAHWESTQADVSGKSPSKVSLRPNAMWWPKRAARTRVSRSRPSAMGGRGRGVRTIDRIHQAGPCRLYHAHRPRPPVTP
jgi:hypothetical protein